MDERVNFPLPLIEGEKLDIDGYVFLIQATLKKQLIHVLEGNKTMFESELSNVVEAIYTTGYNKGLSHMDRMHAQLDKLDTLKS
jgi:hypothetical protein